MRAWGAWGGAMKRARGGRHPAAHTRASVEGGREGVGVGGQELSPCRIIARRPMHHPSHDPSPTRPPRRSHPPAWLPGRARDSLTAQTRSAFSTAMGVSVRKVVRGVLLTRAGREERAASATGLRELVRLLPSDLFRCVQSLWRLL